MTIDKLKLRSFAFFIILSMFIASMAFFFSVKTSAQESGPSPRKTILTPKPLKPVPMPSPDAGKKPGKSPSPAASPKASPTPEKESPTPSPSPSPSPEVKPEPVKSSPSPVKPSPSPAKPSPVPSPERIEMGKPVPSPKKTEEVKPKPSPSPEKIEITKPTPEPSPEKIEITKPESTPIAPKPISSPAKVETVTPKPSPKVLVPVPVKTAASPKPVKPKPVVKPKNNGEETTYRKSHWDVLAKKVNFTVKQESQLKKILTGERDRIMTARSETAENMLKVLKPDQRSTWDKMYQRADKSGDYGDYKKRLLLSPVYLSSIFKLDGSQKSRLFGMAWEYSRRVEKIRKQTRLSVQKTLLPAQFARWEKATVTRIATPNLK